MALFNFDFFPGMHGLGQHADVTVDIHSTPRGLSASRWRGMSKLARASQARPRGGQNALAAALPAALRFLEAHAEAVLAPPFQAPNPNPLRARKSKPPH